MLWGGYEGAKRQMLGVFPDYMEPDPAVFPIEPFTFHYRKSDQLTHRDFLGSLMGLQLKRETVGDILVSEGNCVLFVTDKVSPLVQNEVQKIGRVGVRVSAGIQVPISTEQRFQELVGTVASLRLDCVVAFFTGKSREKAGELIHSGMVFLNYREMAEKDVPVAPGDVITVRGYGKAQLSDQIKKTKKDRYLISLQKYIS